jgi:hypothetical protein
MRYGFRNKPGSGNTKPRNMAPKIIIEIFFVADIILLTRFERVI